MQKQKTDPQPGDYQHLKGAMNIINDKSREKGRAVVRKYAIGGGIFFGLVTLGAIVTLAIQSLFPYFQNTPTAAIPPAAIVQEYQPTSTLEQLASTKSYSPTQAPQPSKTSLTDYLENSWADYLDGNFTSAIQLLEACIQSYPQSGDCYNRLGMANREIGNFTNAIANHDKAISLNPRYDFYWERAATYNRMKNYDKSIADCESCLDINPDFGECYLGLGMNYREKKNFSLAIENINKAMAIHPDKYEYYWERAATYLRMKDYDKSIADCKTCLEINPSYGECYLGLGMNYREKKNYTLSLEYFGKAMSINPNKWEYYFERSATYQRMGNATLANNDLAKARELGYSH